MKLICLQIGFATKQILGQENYKTHLQNNKLPKLERPPTHLYILTNKAINKICKCRKIKEYKNSHNHVRIFKVF